ncbi:MAG: hypothetical protein Q9217_002600 [Psora testacea]
MTSQAAFDGFENYRPLVISQKLPQTLLLHLNGVLLRSSQPLPRARKALSFLQHNRIPFILLTNGGGKSEKERVEELSDRLDIPLDRDLIVQSHTPFKKFVTGGEGEPALREKCVLVIGGAEDKCRRVAQNWYGFENVITPGDLISAFPSLWPFTSPQTYASCCRPLPKTQLSPKHVSAVQDKDQLVKVDAIMVFNDPRDWGLDTQIILDLLMSEAGYLGSLSPKNGDASLLNRGYQQDGQPPIYFSNSDLFWAAAYHLPRLGQGGFREALEGVWSAVTGGERMGVRLEKKMFGKPYQGTYDFAERRLQEHHGALHRGRIRAAELKNVYMVGDNPESDILGTNQYKSTFRSTWHSILVRSGVYSGGEPLHKPRVVVDDVWDAVEWAMKDAEAKHLQAHKPIYDSRFVGTQNGQSDHATEEVDTDNLRGAGKACKQMSDEGDSHYKEWM